MVTLFNDLDLINENDATWNMHKFKKIQPSITAGKNQKTKLPQKDEKFEKWNLENIDDSPSSIFLPPLRAKTLLSWQMNTVVAKTADYFFCSRKRICDIPFQF